MSIAVSGQEVKYAFANIAQSTTDGAIISAVTNKRIRVLGVAMRAGATTTNVTFNSKPAGAGSAISATFASGVNDGPVLGVVPHGWFQTNLGEGLTATTGAGSTVGIQVAYTEDV